MIGFPRREEITAQFSGVSWAVPTDLLNAGDNTVGVKLIKRGGGSDKQLQVSRVELATTE